MWKKVKNRKTNGNEIFDDGEERQQFIEKIVIDDMITFLKSACYCCSYFKYCISHINIIIVKGRPSNVKKSVSLKQT